MLGSAYSIGQSALAAYQAAVAVTGQNIANVGNPNYTRLTGRLEALYGGHAGVGIAPGLGVNLTGLNRHIDEAVEARLRQALGSRSGAELRYQTLSRVEGLYNELTETDLSTQLTNFFGSLGNLQTDPLETTARDLVLANADQVVQSLQRHRSGLLEHVADLNTTVAQMTQRANGIVDEVAKLNELIVTTEARSPGGSAALRDRRDTLLRELGTMMDIQVREQRGGVVNVYVGSEPVVDFTRSRGFTTQVVNRDGMARLEVRFADNQGTVRIHDGRLGAVLQTRDEHIGGQLERLDGLARGLIYEVNRVHSSGQGLRGYTQLTGTYPVRNPSVPLNNPAAGLAFPVQSGTFLVHVRDQTTGSVTTTQVEIDLDGLRGNDTTLLGLAAALGSARQVGVGFTPDGRIDLQAQAGYELSFSEDTSGVLAALGLGTFFTGTNASTIAVNGTLKGDPRLLATSLDGAPGDGRNAGRLALLGERTSDLLGGVSIEQFHQSTVHGLGVTVAGAQTSYEAADAVYSSLLAQREAVSGVSLDEEAIHLAKFERSYQGAARFLSVLDSLSNEVLALVR